MIKLDNSPALSFLPKGAYQEALDRALECQKVVQTASGAGGDKLGWRRLLSDPDRRLLKEVSELARAVRQDADAFVSIGIGGSYLGAKAVIDALRPYFPSEGPEVLFAGKDMSGAYLERMLHRLEGKSVYVNVISKSGTTLEPALAFRVLRNWMEERFEDADSRIIVTTDPDQGALNALREAHPYRKFVIPEDVGGRFSVFTPVGLLPIAVAGIDIHELFEGAVREFEALQERPENEAVKYAAVRTALMEAGYTTEILAHFEPSLKAIGGWWQQLFGESEGKEHTGLFPVSVQYSTDLHSLGQYVQEGKRMLIETFLMAREDGGSLTVPDDPENLDGLNYLAGTTFTEINKKAYEGTALAHAEGGVPVMTVWLDDLSAASIGAMLYFFQHTVAVSGYMIRVNPFDQPGVEAYKKAMFRLLGKP